VISDALKNFKWKPTQLAVELPISNAPETILIIHGTFARRPPNSSSNEHREKIWWEKGGSFCEKLDTALQTAGHPARCWWHLKSPSVWDKEVPQALRTEFSWSGANSEVARQEAGQALAEYIAELDYQKVGRYHIVCHSHGGNVLLHALRALPLAPKYLGKIVFLGTPFLELKKRTTFLFLQGLFLLSLIAILSAAGYALYQGYSLRGPEILLGILLFIGWRYWMEHPRGSKPPRETLGYSFLFQGDEAFSALREILKRRGDPKQFLSEVLEEKHPLCPAFRLYFGERFPWLKRWFYQFLYWIQYEPVPPATLTSTPTPTPTPTSQPAMPDMKALLNSIMTIGNTLSESFLPLSMNVIYRLVGVVKFVIWGLLFIPNLFLSVAIWIWRFLIRLALRMGLGAGLDMGLGDDHLGYFVSDVCASPPGYGVEQVPINEAVEKQAKDAALHSMTEALAEALYGKGEGEVPVLVRRVREAFTNVDLLHAQYYRNDSIISQIKDVIRRPDTLTIPPPWAPLNKYLSTSGLH
jgi:hypothetical protein